MVKRGTVSKFTESRKREVSVWKTHLCKVIRDTVIYTDLRVAVERAMWQSLLLHGVANPSPLAKDARQRKELGTLRKLGLGRTSIQVILTANFCFCWTPNRGKTGSNNTFLMHPRELS